MQKQRMQTKGKSAKQRKTESKREANEHRQDGIEDEAKDQLTSRDR